MKRIKAACLCQTLLFLQKDDVDPKQAAQASQEEVAHYKQQLERSHIQYKILSEGPQPDGSILVKVIKQYNSAPVGDYFA